MEKRRLGRGLDALITGSTKGTAVTEQAAGSEQANVSVARIEHNPFQPRKAFDAEELSALSESIRTHGILQPLVVRHAGDRYQLVAGERRLRAAQAAGLDHVPVRIVDFNDQQVLEAALVENIQRSDLNPIEKAQGFQEHLRRFRLTHDELAGRLGLDRTTVTNLVRLLELPEEVQSAVRVGQISAGHARALLGITDRPRQVSLCKEIIARGHSVRATEALVKEHKPAGRSNKSKTVIEKTAHLLAIEEELRHSLAARVTIRLTDAERGQIVLGFESNEDFERLLGLLRGHPAA